ncbi:inorganic phosphate transporter [Vogesella fluminis]|uniref:inorganic phosphate transporter n=1 Tax=Vogesella fluminis TaxID=1069161 RepID=UPI003634C92D
MLKVFKVQSIVDSLHIVSGFSICMSRAVNDTPKLIALLLAAHILSVNASLVVIAAGMGIGGLLNSRKVAETVSKKLVRLEAVQGLSANFVTSMLVIFASKLGFPVSTTHVSIGAIFGAGCVSRTASAKELSKVVASWITTLPFAAIISAGLAYAFAR